MAGASELRARFDALERAYSTGHHGRWAARERADALDAWFVERLTSAEGVALLALGGYGRRLQLPRSDIDVLLVHTGLPGSVLTKLGERLWYPLWDGGFTVSPLVRTPDGCAAAAAERLDSLTALLDARLITGDPALAGSAISRATGVARADPVACAERIAADRERRRERSGSCTHDIAPDLKEGIGGLRDIASIGWLAAATGAELLRPSERTSVDAAEEFLVRARSALHLETGKRSDRLVVELQPDVAAGMGFDGEPGLPAIDGLMRTVFEHARTVDAAVRAAVDRARSEGHPETAALHGPTEVLDALAVAVELGREPSAALLDAIEGAPIDDPVEWDEAVRDAFLRLLRRGDGGALDALDRVGLLTRFLPVWADVRCRPQRDPYHRFTVDEHLTRAAVTMAALLDGQSDDPLVPQMVSLVDDTDALLLGALFHDIGKVGKGEHVPIGAAIAREQLARMALPDHTRELAAFMVAEHLLFPDTATRRDLTDENLILDVAARVGTPERLAALYLLAVADAEATSPAAWTPWRQTLVRELIAKVERAFERGEMGEALAAELTDRIGLVRDLLTDEHERDVDAFVLRMPRGYFLTAEPAQVARHYHTITPPLGMNEVRSVAAPGVRPGTYELLVVAGDRHGLLANIAGALAIGGVSILSAQAFTTEDGTAVDLFEVEGAFEPEIAERHWRAFRSTLRRALEGSISIEQRVRDKRRVYPAPKVPTPVTVRVDNDASEFSTVIEVGAPDRIGLLHDITRTFVDLDLDVHLAKVATFAGRVVDAFYVRDELGRKVIDAGRLDEARAMLSERLAGV